MRYGCQCNPCTFFCYPDPHKFVDFFSIYNRKRQKIKKFMGVLSLSLNWNKYRCICLYSQWICRIYCERKRIWSHQIKVKKIENFMGLGMKKSTISIFIVRFELLGEETQKKAHWNRCTSMVMVIVCSTPFLVSHQ